MPDPPLINALYIAIRVSQDISNGCYVMYFAPTGVQGMLTLSVRLCVSCTNKTRAVNLHLLGQRAIRALTEQPKSNQAIRDHYNKYTEREHSVHYNQSHKVGA